MGEVSSVLVRNSRPPPLPTLRAHLVAKGPLLLAIRMVKHMVWLFFFSPLAHVAPLPARALERGWEASPLAHMAPLPTEALEVRVRVTNLVQPVLVL